MDDLISRQAAIDAIIAQNGVVDKSVAKRILLQLPSAEPFGEDTNVPCNDTISRQEAIDALAKFVPYEICDESTESYVTGLTDAYNLICQLPSAESLTEEDYTELHDRFGEYVEFIVRDMITGNGKRWKT